MKSARIAEARARVELALPASIAYRLAGVFIPQSDDDREFIASCCEVFNAAAMEPVEGLPLAKRESHHRAVLKLRAELLDQYEGRGAVTVYRAAHFWLQDLIDREILAPSEEGPFTQFWGALGQAFARDKRNMEEWENCGEEAHEMSVEWRKWLEGRNYYADEV